ncbi:MAG: hypothetical protein DRI24_06895 [Deltaproteobacteria bacterium]|nr:MAG: hypothetical protein DRI24_06895 [Deltaproteobacteria bacterium]
MKADEAVRDLQWLWTSLKTRTMFMKWTGINTWSTKSSWKKQHRLKLILPCTASSSTLEWISVQDVAVAALKAAVARHKLFFKKKGST